MPTVFISYRREDSAYPAHQIQRELAKHFGSDSVVFDVDTIPIGTDFRKYLIEQVNKCDILIAVIGDQWIEILRQRIKEPNDFIRIEIQAALERGIPVVPVLVGKASVPSERDLPQELEGLCYMHAAEVRAGPDLQTHLKRLIRGLDRLAAKRKTEKEKHKSAVLEKHEKEKNKLKTVEEVPFTAQKLLRDKRLSFGIGSVILILILSVIVWFLYSKPTRLKPYINSIGMKFIFIPAGNFMMGSELSPEEVVQIYGGKTAYYKPEHPRHEVTISNPFYLQSTEVTQGQWKRVMGDNLSEFKECGDDCPIDNITWDDAQKFIKKINEIEGTDKYRLPTEAEWEYACRAGTTTEFSFGDDVEIIDDYAWILTNSKDSIHPVGTLMPNPWGLYDMHGNVWEWVQDWYGEYPNWFVTETTLTPDIGNHVLRGGSWGLGWAEARCAFRSQDLPYFRAHGFRCAMTVK